MRRACGRHLSARPRFLLMAEAPEDYLLKKLRRFAERLLLIGGV